MRQRILVLVLGLALAGCADPLEDVPRLDDVDVPSEAAQADAVAAGDADAVVADDAPRDVSAAQAAPPQRGFLGFLRGRAEAAKAPAAETAPEDPVAEEAAAAAGVTEVAAAAPAAAPQRRTGGQGGGLFGGMFAGGGGGGGGSGAGAPKPGDPDYEQVGPGVTLPYGKIARLCGVSASRLGKLTQKYPERGRGYALYDSNPGSTGLRNFYLTGFDDGCARQFTAALVLFGAPETYEQIRYSAAGATQPVSETDVAYERVKSRVCRVGRGKPCGSRIKTLSRNTVFVSVYERFGSNARWKNLLLHDGAVEALDIK